MDGVEKLLRCSRICLSEIVDHNEYWRTWRAGGTAFGWPPIRRGVLALGTIKLKMETYIAKTARKLSMSAIERNAKNPFAATKEVLNEERAHFAYHCATCHANDGKQPDPATRHYASTIAALLTGSAAVTTVPSPVERMSSVPPSSRTRSRIPLSPTPGFAPEFREKRFSAGIPLP